MRKIRFSAIGFTTFSFLFFFLFAFPFTLAQDVDEEVKKGIYQFRQENYDEAFEIFKAARASAPTSSLAAYYLGLTYKRMENYVEAKKELEASLHLTPKIKGALIELIDVLYRLDNLEEAKKWIQVAEEEGVRPAQAAFLKGLTLLKSKEYDQAVASFEDAKGLDDALAPSADYQIGVAYLRQRNLKRARDTFRRLIADEAETDVATYAERYLYEIDRKLERERPLHFSLRFAFEYDSNVTLNPDDFAFVTPISDKDDTRQVWDFRGDYTFRNEDRTLGLKTGYAFHFSKQNDLGRYDYLSNTFTVQPYRSFEKVMATFPVQYSHNVVNSKNYLSSVSVGNINNIRVANSHMAQLGILYKYDDYLRPPYGEESRTGNEIIGTAGWFWFFPNREGFASVKYALDKDWAHGDNWEYFGNRVDLGVLVPFWERFKLGLNSQFFFKNFDKTHNVFAQKRKDRSYALSSFLSFEVVKNTEVQCQYTYINNQSNINLYEYARHVFSWGVQYKY